MVRGALVLLALGTLVALPGVSADSDVGLVDGVGSSLPAVPVVPDLPSSEGCIGLANGDWYVEYEDYPAGGFRVYVGAPIGPITFLDAEVRDASVPSTGSDWVGVGVKVLGPGCEAQDAVFVLL
ncbi:MAG: hypothetical protein WC876_08295 [Candidatus Thermoplasmatota archaeon]|jgi:hypothetical protein